MVEEGIAFLKELFHSLVKIREQLTEAIVEVSEDLELEGFARRILAHPDKIYVIFKADEVEKVYRKVSSLMSVVGKRSLLKILQKSERKTSSAHPRRPTMPGDATLQRTRTHLPQGQDRKALQRLLQAH